MIALQSSYESRSDLAARQDVDPNDLIERRRRYLLSWNSLKLERNRQMPTWRDQTDLIMPERGRFVVTDHNKPKNTSKILNNVPTRAARALAAGLMSGITSPARPWFNLTLPDQDLAEWGPARLWLYKYNLRMRQILALGGFYKVAAMGVYPDLITYGTACCFVEEDPIRVVRFNSLAMGQYALRQDGQGRVNSVFHEEAWTVSELVNEFGWEKVSDSVRTNYNNGQYDQHRLVLHVVEPNAEFLPGNADRFGKKWGSVWIEVGGLEEGTGSVYQPSQDAGASFLRQSGYNEFPALCPRWATTGRDVYGTGPGHDALPDCKQLMMLEKRSLLAIDKMVNPSMIVPEALRLTRLSMLPGDPVYKPTGMSAHDKIEPAFVPIPGAIDKTEMKARQAEQRIGQAFFSDLVMMLIQDERQQPATAEEIRAKQQEKMLQLGPVLENLNDEFLSPLIERVAAIMERRGLIEPPPRELQGMNLKVEFISILAQAQKLIGTGAKERLVAFVGQVAQLKGPDAIDMLNTDELIKGYADDLGAPPTVLEDDDKVAQMRKERAAQAQAQQQQAAMAQAASSAKDASKADLGGDNALSRLVGEQAGPTAQAQDQLN